MANITESLKISMQTVKNEDPFDPYVRQVGSDAINAMMKDLVPAGRVVKPSAISIAAGVVTVPAGTVFYLSTKVETFRCELSKDVLFTTDHTLSKLYLEASKGLDGLLIVSMLAAASYPSGSLALGVASGANPWSVFTEDSGLDKVTAKKVYCSMMIANQATNGSYWMYVPCAGKVTKLAAVRHIASTHGNITLTGKIGGTAITTGVVTIGDADAAGAVKTAVPTALNAVAADSSIEMLLAAPGSTEAGALTVVAEITQ